MSWRKKVTDNIADIFRFASYTFYALGVIVFSGFLFWFITKLIWYSAQYLDHRLFGKPWF